VEKILLFSIFFRLSIHTSVRNVGRCLEEVSHWMSANRFKLNADKTDLLWASSKYSQPSLGSKGLSLQIDSDTVTVSDHVGVPRVTFLQRVQNSVARVVTQAPRRSSATDLRRQLHWLPIRQRVSFKLGTITFRAVHTGTPTYLACELHRHQPLRALRSGTATTLQSAPASRLL